MPLGVFWQIFQIIFNKHGSLGARTDKAHLALKDVYQLRQLIKGSLP